MAATKNTIVLANQRGTAPEAGRNRITNVWIVNGQFVIHDDVQDAGAFPGQPVRSPIAA